MGAFAAGHKYGMAAARLQGSRREKSVGYDVYDMYDLGEFNQKGTYATKYGTKDEYIKAVESFKSQGIEVLADVVLNHMMGADEAQTVIACEDAGENREEEIGGEREISAWTRFTFPGRQGKYSSFTWDYTNFSGTDWDEKTKKEVFTDFRERTGARILTTRKQTLTISWVLTLTLITPRRQRQSQIGASGIWILLSRAASAWTL